MTPIEQLKSWLASFTAYDILGNLRVDYTDCTPCSSISPAGMVEVSRSEDIEGNKTVSNQLNFALYAVMEKAPRDNQGAMLNADWVVDFQRWIQEQSVRRLTPTFGNVDTEQEVVTAQNGALYETNGEGTAIYFVQLSIEYKLFFKE